MALSKITTASITDDAVTTAKVNPAQTDITSVGTLTSFASTGIDDNANATSIFIDANEDVGIHGSAVPTHAQYTGGCLHIKQPTTGATNGAQLRITNQQNGHTASDGFHLSHYGDANTYYNNLENGGHIWYANGSERFKIESSGDATISNGNLVIGTAGKGIDFSATADGSGTDTSELLDDYEEGEWTPIISSASGSGVVTTHQSGRYTKVGREVRVSFQCVLNTKGSGSGNMNIQGLPYVTGSGFTHYGFAFGYFSGTNNEQRGGWASANTSKILFNRGGNMDAQVQLSDLTNGYYLTGSFFYFTDS